MARLRVLGSSSMGNSYVITVNNGDSIVLELGMPIIDIQRALDYREDSLKFVLVTHKHTDHSKFVDRAIQRGWRIFSNTETANAHPGVEILQPMKLYKLGDFIIRCFNVEHNAECYSYMIEHPDIGRLVFVTDAVAFPYRIKGIKHFLIEANYSNDVIVDRMCNSEEYSSTPTSHMSIENSLMAIKVNKSPELENIILCHLSMGNSDEIGFKKLMEEEVPSANVFIAEKGLEVEINKSVF